MAGSQSNSPPYFSAILVIVVGTILAAGERSPLAIPQFELFGFGNSDLGSGLIGLGVVVIIVTTFEQWRRKKRDRQSSIGRRKFISERRHSGKSPIRYTEGDRPDSERRKK